MQWFHNHIDGAIARKIFSLCNCWSPNEFNFKREDLKKRKKLLFFSQVGDTGVSDALVVFCFAIFKTWIKDALGARWNLMEEIGWIYHCSHQLHPPAKDSCVKLMSRLFAIKEQDKDAPDSSHCFIANILARFWKSKDGNFYTVFKMTGMTGLCWFLEKEFCRGPIEYVGKCAKPLYQFSFQNGFRHHNYVHRHHHHPRHQEARSIKVAAFLSLTICQ